MKKKIVTILLCSMMVLSLVACGENKNSNTKTNSLKNDTQTTITKDKDDVNEDKKEDNNEEIVTKNNNDENIDVELSYENIIEDDKLDISYKSLYRDTIDAYLGSTNNDVSVITYSLIDINDDDIPELVIDNPGFFVSVYSIDDLGEVQCLIDEWGYGAFGNAGYEYCEKESMIRCWNSDYAGAVRYLYIYEMFNDHIVLMTPDGLSVWMTEDTNLNGELDEDEILMLDENLEKYYVISMDSVDYENIEISQEEFVEWSTLGEETNWKYINGEMDYEHIMEQLQ